MPTKYEKIYAALREKIEAGLYPAGALLPSEMQLTQEFHCSRNTVRRALAQLAIDGYVQAVKGKGVRIIYSPTPVSNFNVGGIETFHESAARNNKKNKTSVLLLQDTRITPEQAELTGFSQGTPVTHLVRLRYLDNEPLILDNSYFRSDLVPNLTVAIAQDSVYNYIEHSLNMTVTTSKRVLTVERTTQADRSYLDMKDYNCVAVLRGYTFDSNGEQFEFTESRHRPDAFSFHDVAIRHKPGV